MITTTWQNAPAGFLGLGSVDVRRACGTGIAAPFGGVVTGPTGAVQGLAVRLRAATEQAPAQIHTQRQSTQNNGTTLGYLPSRRPLS